MLCPHGLGGHARRAQACEAEDGDSLTPWHPGPNPTLRPGQPEGPLVGQYLTAGGVVN